MTGWGAGYVTDVDYTFGYFRELSPVVQRFALLCASVRPPAALGQSGGACLELGFGQGVSLNIHAAASPGEYWGTDFSPAQAAFAQELATVGNTGARIFDDSFEELMARRDLPQFDAIAMHGIWSWVSSENRAVLVEIMRRHLKPGGVVYVSYNALPGWYGSAGLRDLFELHVDRTARPHEGVLAHMGAAVEFAQRLQQAQARFFLMNPDAAERLKRIEDKNRTYLAHEYLNAEWRPMSVARVAKDLEAAKLTLAGTVDLLQAFDRMHIDEKGLQILSEIHDVVYREAVRDYLVNQVFRRDLYLRGPRRLTLSERAQELSRQRFTLLTRAQDVPMTVHVTRGEVKLDEALYAPLLAALEREQRPKSLAALEAELRPRGIEPQQILDGIVMLIGTGHVSPTQDDRTIEAASSRCRVLNRSICEMAAIRPEITFLASPVVGHGIPVGRVEQLFLMARSQRAKMPEELAIMAWRAFASQGQRLISGGRVLETEEENLDFLRSQARHFLDAQLPVMAALKLTF